MSPWYPASHRGFNCTSWLLKLNIFLCWVNLLPTLDVCECVCVCIHTCMLIFLICKSSIVVQNITTEAETDQGQPGLHTEYQTQTGVHSKTLSQKWKQNFYPFFETGLDSQQWVETLHCFCNVGTEQGGGQRKIGFRLREKEQSKLQRPNLPSEWLLRSPGGLLSAVHLDHLDCTNMTKDKMPVCGFWSSWCIEKSLLCSSQQVAGLALFRFKMLFLATPCVWI